MRLLKQSILPLLGALAAAAMSFFIGCIEGSKYMLENNAAANLVLNVNNYNLLEEGKIDRVKGDLGTSIILDLETYDQLQIKDSTLSAKYKISASMIENARTIAEERKKAIPVQTESK